VPRRVIRVDAAGGCAVHPVVGAVADSWFTAPLAAPCRICNPSRCSPRCAYPPPQLTILMAQLGLACKATSRACAKAGIAGLFGLAGEVRSRAPVSAMYSYTRSPVPTLTLTRERESCLEIYIHICICLYIYMSMPRPPPGLD